MEILINPERIQSIKDNLKKLKNRRVFIFGTFLFLLLVFCLSFYLVQNSQNFAKRAQVGNQVQEPITKPEDFITIFPAEVNEQVISLKISGEVVLEKPSSFIRVILIDSNKDEYLVFEAYPLLSDSSTFSITESCEETCVLDKIIPVFLRVEGNSASFNFTKKNFGKAESETNLNVLGTNIGNEQRLIKAEKEREKIDRLNEGIREKGQKWIAGETSISKLTYSQKKKLFSSPDGKLLNYLPNLQGFEYYKGGIFELPSQATTFLAQANTSYPLTWDWRNRHGENWMTPAKDQGSCGSCWDFASVGAVEADANLYFNQHLNLDLSEQDILSCSNAGTCGGGNNKIPLVYMKQTGVVNETCFPYMAADLSCAKCENWPSQVVKISGREFIEGWMANHENWFKESLIKKGTLDVSVSSWNHMMVLIGWETDSVDNQVIWIFKNSWSANWGENGYLRMKVPLYEIVGSESAIVYPITVADKPSLQISCVDRDNDNYCNWGISETKPPSCPSFCKPDKDCDDSNSLLGPYYADYNCAKLSDLASGVVLSEERGNAWVQVASIIWTSCDYAYRTKFKIPFSSKISRVDLNLKWGDGGAFSTLVLRKDGSETNLVEKVIHTPVIKGDGWVSFDFSGAPVSVEAGSYWIYLKRAAPGTVWWKSANINGSTCGEVVRNYKVLFGLQEGPTPTLASPTITPPAPTATLSPVPKTVCAGMGGVCCIPKKCDYRNIYSNSPYNGSQGGCNPSGIYPLAALCCRKCL